MNPYLILGAVLGAIVLAGASFYEGIQWEVGKNAQDQLKASQAIIKQYETDAGTIHNAALALSGDQNDTRAKFDPILADLKNALRLRPLPRGCAPDAERVRNFNLAIDAANSTAGK